ncbi:GPI mannosyltransferase 1 [Cytospora mali]|uniref:GPI mannosyltransferase 1 n=1 Tax=Cytospora mali TaxID=578113 RepID=A0A194VK08_CYTMA|nr:GPI mannosyltransferase 1 [Valsa mali]
MPPPKNPIDSSLISHLFTSPVPLYTLSILLRIFLLLYGLWQDANSPLKYTDIDYLVFTDAARFLSHHHPDGPYARETYRYTPLLSWMLLPTTWTARLQWLSVAYFSFGKVLFALADLVAGWLIVKVLTMSQREGGGGMSAVRARKFAAIWLVNPMVATISTRGSSEGLLAVMVMALLYAVLLRTVTLVGILLGLGVHFKIYPFIYAPAIVWWMDEDHIPSTSSSRLTSASPLDRALAFLTPARLKLALVSLITFTGLNLTMYALYGHPFLQHTYLHHVTRIDHRHNFSPYNILLYLTSAHTDGESGGFRIESVAFLPQLLLSCVLIPVVMAKKDLPSTMLAQTWAFVAFNKVCTSQYFIWYLIFLPLYLPRSSFFRNPISGIAALLLWILTQAAWLQQGYALEFLGESTFVPGLWLSGQAFFLANCWILGIIVADIA